MISGFWDSRFRASGLESRRLGLRLQRLGFGVQGLRLRLEEQRLANHQRIGRWVLRELHAIGAGCT